jgi:hypothetical protein
MLVRIWHLFSLKKITYLGSKECTSHPTFAKASSNLKSLAILKKQYNIFMYLNKGKCVHDILYMFFTPSLKPKTLNISVFFHIHCMYLFIDHWKFSGKFDISTRPNHSEAPCQIWFELVAIWSIHARAHTYIDIHQHYRYLYVCVCVCVCMCACVSTVVCVYWPTHKRI